LDSWDIKDKNSISLGRMVSLINLCKKYRYTDKRIQEMDIKIDENIGSYSDLINEMFFYVYGRKTYPEGYSSEKDEEEQIIVKKYSLEQLEEQIPDFKQTLEYFNLSIDENDLSYWKYDWNKVNKDLASPLYYLSKHPNLKKFIKDNFEIERLYDLKNTIEEIKKQEQKNKEYLKKIEIIKNFYYEEKINMSDIDILLDKEYSLELIQWLVQLKQDTWYDFIKAIKRYHYGNEKLRDIQQRFKDPAIYQKAKEIWLFTELDDKSGEYTSNVYHYRRIKELMENPEFLDFLLAEKELNLVNLAMDHDINGSEWVDHKEVHNNYLRELYEQEKEADFKFMNFAKKIRLIERYDWEYSHSRSSQVMVIKNRKKIKSIFGILFKDKEYEAEPFWNEEFIEEIKEISRRGKIENIEIVVKIGIKDINDILRLKDILSEAIMEYVQIVTEEMGIKEVNDLIRLKDVLSRCPKEKLQKMISILDINKIIDTEEKAKLMSLMFLIKDLDGLQNIINNIKSEDKKVYLNCLVEIGGTEYIQETKEKMITKILSLQPEQAKNYTEVFQIFDNSISQDIQHIKNELIEEILNTDNPKEAAETINGIFTRNNLPLVGKIYKVFNELYKDKKIDEMFSQNDKLSPILRTAENNNKKRSIIYKDLINIHIKSWNLSLKNYIEIFIWAEETLRKFENNIKDIDYIQDLPLEGILSEKEQEKLLYLFRKLDTLYESTSWHILPEPENIEKMKLGVSTVNDKTLIEYYNTIRKRMLVREWESLYDNMIKFLKPVWFKSFEEVFEKMEASKEKATERSLKYIHWWNIQLEKWDFIKGIWNAKILENILNRWCASREYLWWGDESWSGKASSDMTPFDIDGWLVTEELSKNSFSDILSRSVSNGYWPITLVVKWNRWVMADTTWDNIQWYTNDTYELFGTLGNDHYGIRTGIPSTEIDFIILKEEQIKQELRNQYPNKSVQEIENEYLKYKEKLFYEIAKNGFYIPVVSDKEWAIIFMPEMYHTFRLWLNYADRFWWYDIENDNGKYLCKKQDNRIHMEKNKDSELYKMINENKSDNPKYKEHAEKNIKMRDITLQRVKHILEENNIRINSEFDFSIEWAQVNDTWSTGRGTDIPTGDVDLDFTVLLDARDYERINEIVELIHKGIGTTERGSGEGERSNGYQIKSKKNNLWNEVENRPDGIALDLLFMKKTQVIEYSSSDAAGDRLKYILKTYGKEAYDQVRANIIIMKKLLKAKSIYKKPEWGISWIGVENRILQNHGSFIEALESFEKTAYQGIYEEWKEPISFNEFQQKYPIYDPWENYKDGGKDNYIFRMKQEWYNGTLEIIKEYRKKWIDGIKNLIDEYVRKKADFGAI
jgi:hypothetical protein